MVINEVLAHSHVTLPDWIEFHNTTDDPINLGGWYLSDSDSDDASRMKYKIAEGTTIAPNGYLVFSENIHFGENSTDPGCLVPFALNENGDQVYLRSGLDSYGNWTGYYESEDFGASETDVSFGRYYRASTDSFNFVPMSHSTPNDENAYPKVGPIVISEIMYHEPDSGGYEYIELYNITDQPVVLKEYDADFSVYVPWQFTEGIDFVFPMDTMIPAYGYLLVVNASESEFRAAYPSVPGSVEVLGPFENGTGLSNSGEKLEISKPGEFEESVRYYFRVDRVVYSDGSHPEGEDPWPTAPDGDGSSLHRIVASDYGNDVINWQSGMPSPGQ